MQIFLFSVIQYQINRIKLGICYNERHAWNLKQAENMKASLFVLDMNWMIITDVVEW